MNDNYFKNYFKKYFKKYFLYENQIIGHLGQAIKGGNLLIAHAELITNMLLKVLSKWVQFYFSGVSDWYTVQIIVSESGLF